MTSCPAPASCGKDSEITYRWTPATRRRTSSAYADASDLKETSTTFFELARQRCFFVRGAEIHAAVDLTQAQLKIEARELQRILRVVKGLHHVVSAIPRKDVDAHPILVHHDV